MIQIVGTMYGGNLWKFRTVSKNEKGSADTIQVIVSPQAGAPLSFHYLGIGPDDYAATRNVFCAVRDEDGNLFNLLLRKSDVDNEKLHLAQRVLADDGDQGADIIGNSHPDLVIANPFDLVFQATTLADNETMTVSIMGVVYGAERPPVTLNPSATMTQVGAYNEFY